MYFPRRSVAVAAGNLAAAIERSSFTPTQVAQAADTTAPELTTRIETGQVTFDELVAVGGLLAVRPNEFFKGVNA
jgi:hypothetical protein